MAWHIYNLSVRRDIRKQVPRQTAFNAYLQCASIVHVHSLLGVLQIVVVVKIDSGIVDENIDLTFSSERFGEGIDAFLTRDI